MAISIQPDGKFLDGRPGYSESLAAAVSVSDQAETGGITARGVKKPSERAQDAITEIANFAKQCGVTCRTMSDAADALSRKAEDAKRTAIHASEKIRVAYTKMCAVDLDKITRYAESAERLVNALSTLDRFNASGKLTSLIAALKGEIQQGQ